MTLSKLTIDLMQKISYCTIMLGFILANPCEDMLSIDDCYSTQGCEWDEDFNQCIQIWDEEDYCEDLSEDECYVSDGCQWTDWGCIRFDGDDGGDNMDFCREFDEEMCEDMPFCDWTDEGCVMSSFGDDGGWNDDGGWEDFNCEEITNLEECYQVGCEWSTVITPNGIFEMCIDPDSEYEDEDSPPECLQDCPEFDFLNNCEEDEDCELSPYNFCDILISWGDNDCLSDCEGEDAEEISDLIRFCEECLQNETCEELFDDDHDEDWEDIICEEITNPEECYEYGCEWTIVETPNGVFEMCVETDDGDWDDDCSSFLEDLTFLPDMSPELCQNLAEDAGTNYYYHCDDTGEHCVEVQGCYAEPLEDGTIDYNWLIPQWDCHDNDDGGGWEDIICEEITSSEECYEYGCEWTILETPNGIFEICAEQDSDDGPPECLLDCEGIEYVNPEEDPYEACDWIISNFGPNNFFNECAYDCDEETMMIINQLSEVCFMCLSDENIDCADIWEDEEENSCSDLDEQDCLNLENCEWIPSNTTVTGGYCIDVEPGGDDGGTGGEEGCFENGEWYCYGCELFINDCEYYECTEDGWIGPFDNCWSDCEDFDYEQCMDNPDCVWIWEENVINDEGYCIDSNNNPDDDLAILRLEHSVGIPGATVSVPLILSNFETVGGLQFSIGGYNSFANISVEWFEATDDCFSASYNELDEELIGIIFSLEGCVYPPNDYRHIADIIFYIDENTSVGQEIPLWFNYTLVSDSSGFEIPSHGEDSQITLGIQGDVNFDGEINILDIVTVVNFAIYADEPNDSEFWASDINYDGLINILDIVQLINIVLDR